jgi:hypothetical protein
MLRAAMRIGSRAAALTAVLLAHVALLDIWTLVPAGWRQRAAATTPAPDALRLRLLPPAPMPQPDPPSRPQWRLALPAPASPAIAIPKLPRVSETAADATPRGPRELASAEPSSVRSGSATPATALDLRLPAPAQRGLPPERPPRAAMPGRIESRIARDLDPRLREQSLGGGRVRFRRGADCVELRDSRIVGIEPFNQSVQSTPRQAEDCAR